MKKILLVLITVFLFTGCFKKEEVVINSKVNNNDNVIKEQVSGDFTFTDVSLIYLNGLSTFKANVKNNSSLQQHISKINMVFKTQSNVVIATLTTQSFDLEADSINNIVVTSDIDLSDAYSVEYIVE